MTKEELETITTEINVFDDGRWHIKLVGVPATTAVKTLRALLTTVDTAGIRSNASAPSHSPTEASDTKPACPTHGKAKVGPSKFGSGWYCKARQGDGYCDWKLEVAS